MADSNKEKKKLGEILGTFFSNLWSKFLSWYRTSWLAKGLGYIGTFFANIFWPLGWIRERTFDKLRFDVQKKVVSILFLLPVTIGFLIFFAYPMVLSLIYSFSTLELGPQGVIIHFAKFYEKVGGAYDFTRPYNASFFQNYIYAFKNDVNFPVKLWSTIGTTLSDCAVITIFSLIVAVMLNGKFKCRALVRAIFFLPVVFNSTAVSAALESSASLSSVMGAGGKNALSTLFDMNVFLQGVGVPKGAITFLTGITNAIYDTISYSGIQILIFLTAIQSVPKHLYEAARMEGATQYEMFWKITLPMVSPMISTVVVYTVIDSYLRSDINKVIDTYETASEYGIHAAMSWTYLGVIALMLLIILGILSKVVFYYDEKK